MAMRKADPVLLEPIMKVEVTVPEEYMGDVIGDINSRRGRIEGMECKNQVHKLLDALFHYLKCLDMQQTSFKNSGKRSLLNANSSL